MKIINFPEIKRADCSDDAMLGEMEDDHCQALRTFALNIATQLRNDAEMNRYAPQLVDKVIMLLVKESRCEK
jgi:hypothetical protein